MKHTFRSSPHPLPSAPDMRRRQPKLRGRQQPSRQHGAIALMATIFISLMIILLASIDIGYLFFQKREMQKVADMAALAGAQQLARSVALPNDFCASAYRVAADNARLGQNFSGITVVSCGNWNPDTGIAPTYYVAYTGGVTPNGQVPPNAIRVQVTKSFDSFFGLWSSQQVTAAAIATTDAPIAVFSVGSSLLRIRPDGTVPDLLTALGIHIDGASLVSYNSLANVMITPSGLLKALGFQIPLTADVGTIKNAVLATTSGCSNGVCTLEALLGAISVVGGQQNLVSTLGLQVSQLTLPIKLFSDDGVTRGLFALIDAANGQAALQTSIDALNLLTAILGLANNHNFGNLNVVIPGITKLQTGIVEPPSIGIGGIGATAYSAQVRVYSELPNLTLAGALSVNLPSLSIDTVNAQGTIRDMCTVKDGNGNDTALIEVTAPVLTLCAGAIGGAPFSTTGSCAANLQAIPLIKLNGAPTPVLSLPHISINALDSNPPPVRLSKGESRTVEYNQLQIGATVTNLMQALLVNVLGQLLNQGQGITKASLAQNLLSASGNVLGTAVGTLNDSLASLKAFAGGLSSDVKDLLSGSLTSTIAGVGNLLTGLLNSVGALLENLLGNVGCLLSPSGYNQCALENQLSGSPGSGANAVSNALLALVALIQKTLAPVLDSIGAALAAQLHTLGLDIGQADVTLIDLHCGGGPNVKLVY